ncbi:MAG: hypothetical protein NTV64_07830 [Polaromonas sp.]|jgi:hypothetical protein|nr:hypothetical protein [Polaromonas sp.]
MQIVRGLIYFLLLTAGVCFALYAATGDQRYKRWGLITLKWTVLAGLGFFGVLIVERMM